MTRNYWIATASFVVFATLVGLSQTEKLSVLSEAVSREQTKRIERELKGLRGHAWAGDYYYGDGLGVNVRLRIAPKSGFVFTWNGCLGLYDLNYGNVDASGGKIKLLFTHPNKREGFEGIAPELLPVQWGERHYLVPTDKLVDFANVVNGGLEPSVGRRGFSRYFLLRDGDDQKKVEGIPTLPSEYLKCILRKPILAQITSVGQGRAEEWGTVTPIVLDAGAMEGLKTGMELHVRNPDRASGRAVVTRVQDHAAEAELRQFGRDSTVPAAGWKLSTRLIEPDVDGIASRQQSAR